VRNLSIGSIKCINLHLHISHCKYIIVKLYLADIIISKYLSLSLSSSFMLNLFAHAAHSFKICPLTRTQSWEGWHLVDMPELVRHFLETHVHLRGAQQKKISAQGGPTVWDKKRDSSV